MLSAGGRLAEMVVGVRCVRGQNRKTFFFFFVQRTGQNIVVSAMLRCCPLHFILKIYVHGRVPCIPSTLWMMTMCCIVMGCNCVQYRLLRPYCSSAFLDDVIYLYYTACDTFMYVTCAEVLSWFYARSFTLVFFFPSTY